MIEKVLAEPGVRCDRWIPTYCDQIKNHHFGKSTTSFGRQSKGLQVPKVTNETTYNRKVKITSRVDAGKEKLRYRSVTKEEICLFDPVLGDLCS